MKTARPIRRQAAALALATTLGMALLQQVPASGATPGNASPAAARASAPAARGYWLAASDGGIFSFGDATFHGSTGNIRLAQPIVGMAATPTGQGYWLAASDGGIFAFGDATFHGSTGNIRLAKPIVGIAGSPTGRGYWLAASDGGIFTFGDAAFFGSGTRASQTFVSMAATPTGRGYWLASREGATFAFGDARAIGSVAGVSQPIVGMARTQDGDGGWLVARDGGVFALGDARFLGSTGGMRLNQPIVTGAAAVGPAPAAASTPLPPPSPSPPAPASVGQGAFRIGLIGDTGYSADDDRKLVSQRARMNKRNLAFVTHDGDIQMQNTPCTDERLRYVKGIFDGFEAPFVFTPGDNEYKNCANSRERLASIRRIFFPDDLTLGRNPMMVERQGAPYVENARWTRGGVVFATMNVPGGGGGIPASANVAWLNGTFDAAQATHAAGVMIVWQADDAFTGSDLGGITEALERRAAAFGRPVVLVHGDGHSFVIDRPWSEVPNLTRVETYFGASGKWVELTVDAATAEVFSFKTMR